MEIYRDKPLSKEELSNNRQKAIARHGLNPGIKFTCDDCDSADRCRLAFDPYNTGGDCLAEK